MRKTCNAKEIKLNIKKNCRDRDNLTQREGKYFNPPANILRYFFKSDTASFITKKGCDDKSKKEWLETKMMISKIKIQ